MEKGKFSAKKKKKSKTFERKVKFSKKRVIYKEEKVGR